MTKKFTDQNFDQEVLKNTKPVMVDFWAPWCGPCLAMEPIIDDLAKEFKDEIIVGKLNVDENKITTEKYSIMSIPNIKIFQNGEVIKEFTGKQSKEMLITELKKYTEKKEKNQKDNKNRSVLANNEKAETGCCSDKDSCDISCGPDNVAGNKDFDFDSYIKNLQNRGGGCNSGSGCCG